MQVLILEKSKIEGSDLKTEKNVLNISNTKSLHPMSSIITQHLHRATVSSILTLQEKSELVVSASSEKELKRSIKTSYKN